MEPQSKCSKLWKTWIFQQFACYIANKHLICTHVYLCNFFVALHYDKTHISLSFSFCTITNCSRICLELCLKTLNLCLNAIDQSYTHLRLIHKRYVSTSGLAGRSPPEFARRFECPTNLFYSKGQWRPIIHNHY